MLMMRPPRCCRMWTEAARIVLNVPLRCTLTTASQSSSLMLKIIRSRRLPATLTRMSMRPHVDTACSTMAAPCLKSATEPVLATASPPALRIVSTTALATEGSLPVPLMSTPGSFTTTLAPAFAKAMAMPRTMPRPAPVTTAVLPSSLPIVLPLIVRLTSLSALVRQDEPPRGRQQAGHAVDERPPGVRHLPRSALAAQQARGLDDRKDAVHPRVRVREPASVGVDGQGAAGRGAAVLEEGHALAALGEAERLQHERRPGGEGVVEHDVLEGPRT